ncbi:MULTISPECIES: transposase [unclassified Fusobacterium]|uniref:transposase n=1 Tax=unclassified Fusobacterium TaxID=2648384 RepID=UPI0032C3FC4D
MSEDYNLYQYLLGSIQSNNYQSLFRKIDELGKETSHYMKTALKTLKKYKKYVTKTLLTTYNNGMIEGTNNLIKSVKRFSFGYRYFSNFRKRILIIKGLIDINTCNI